MARTLELLRANLARELGRYATGTADTNTDVLKLIDAEGLVRFTVDDELIGNLIYIRYDAAGLGAAPQGDSRLIADYTFSTKTIVPEYAFSAFVTAGDIYDLFLAPLSFNQWNWAINEAILEAWPEVWARLAVQFGPVMGASQFLLPMTAQDILSVRLAFTDANLRGYPMQPLVENLDWIATGEPGAGSLDPLTLRLLRPPEAADVQLLVEYKSRYPELATGETSYLDEAYIIYAAGAKIHTMLANTARGEAAMAMDIEEAQRWYAIAAERKTKLAADLLGIPAVGVKK